tara:strand:- start:348 stop:1241 length:894 start_codon:yes stop_codon:yes gene_type:complete
MKIFKNFTSNDYIQNDVSTTCIGGFDGVHQGHQQLMKSANKFAKDYQVVTFDTLPKLYFNSKHKLLTTNEDKTKLIQNFNPVNLVFINFDHVVKYSPKEFCNMLEINLKTKNIFVGSDFKFGLNREGDVDYLIKHFGNDSIHIIDDYQYKDNKVSSTLIKSYLSEGKVELANESLGYKYSFTGNVIKGEQKGTLIGFPTANLEVNNNIQIPKIGVYEVDVNINNLNYAGIMNIGYKPTLSEYKKLSLEVHIFNFNNDIYNTGLTVNFKSFIRDEKKFNNVDELIQQINKDIDKINKN